MVRQPYIYSKFSSFFHSFLLNERSDNQEKQYKLVCDELSSAWSTVVSAYAAWGTLKSERPKTYYASLLSVLLVLAWLGNLINNLLLTYLIVLFVVMFPGLKHHGIINQYLAIVLSYVNQYTKKNK